MNTDTITPRHATWSPDKPSAPVTAFLERPAFDAQAEELARKILEEIRKGGDAAVALYIKRFDGAALKPEQFAVARAELNAARVNVDAAFMTAAREAYERIANFARAGMKQDWSMSSPKGGMLGEQFMPFDRVGIYIPGGQAPLVSTALMTITLAKTAGVAEIVACSPAGTNNQLNPALLYAMELAGATEIYKIGGIQAIGAMAYGTETIRKVDKIAGPGGTFVTAAKRCVYGDVALDLVAGPSEIAVLADESAAPEIVAADLLSQVEHGTGFEKALLVTDSTRLAEAATEQIIRQAEKLSRRETIIKALKQGVLIVLVNNLDAGMELCNLFAPEHLEIITQEPRRWVKKVRHAGAIFVGRWTPECAGDFVAGPSHVLPTGGAARRYSGLTVDDFRKRSSIVSFTRADLQSVLPVIETMGRVEGLDAHARSARIRFEQAMPTRAFAKQSIP